MNSEQIFGIIRAVMVALGTYLASSGVVSATDWQTISGALVTLLGVAWSIYSNRSKTA